MRKTYWLLCQLERLIIKGFSASTKLAVNARRVEISNQLRNLGKRTLKEMALFFLGYAPPLPKNSIRHANKIEQAWCSIFNSLREHYGINKRSTTEFITLQEWVSWASRLKIS